MKKLTKILAGSWVVLNLFIAFPGAASANGNLTIVVKNPNPYNENQSWFSYEKKSGESIDDVATVKNLSDKPVKAHVYAVDATSNDSGSFILKLENENRTGIGLWTKLNTGETITIPPQQSVDFPFHIDVPNNLEPGQYFGGLVLEEVADAPQTVNVAAASENGQRICCTNILVKTRIGLRIYLTIPGTINDRLEWSNFKTIQKSKNTSFQFDIRNTGNVALEPVAMIEIFDLTGKQVDRFEKSLGESLPNTYITPSVSWENQPLGGQFKAVGKLTYRIKSQAFDQQLHGSAELGSKTVNFTVMPWKILFLVLLGAMAGTIAFAYHRKNRRQLKLNWEPYEVRADDNIMKIAESRKVDWKKLARVNKISAPYLLNPGEKIRVPKNKQHEQPSLFEENKHE